MEKEYKSGDKVMVEFEVLANQHDGVVAKTELGGYNVWLPYRSIEQPFEPREMMIWNDDAMLASKEKVVGIFQGRYMYQNGLGTFISVKNAKELPKELEIGKVYKNSVGALVYHTGNRKGWGFTCVGMFDRYLTMPETNTSWEEYPLEQFEQHLVTEAKIRGYEKGVWIDRKIIDIDNNRRIVRLGSSNPFVEITEGDVNIFTEDDIKIFKNGIWTKIIE